jgi:hypothetical protein
VFVVQWKNVQAYFDVSTTTRLNFQIRLHEATNIIEYNYGPVAAGTFSGSDIGAMVGLNDHISGNYHFYDIALGGTGTASQGISTLSPLVDWPGPDSSYVIGPDVTALTTALDPDWILVSVPLTRTVNAVSSVFPAAEGGTAFGFNGTGYQLQDSLIPGSGYWAKFPASAGQVIWGNPLPTVSVDVASGWNLIGSVDHPVSAPSGGIIESYFFEFTPTGYSPTSTLLPGRGYWVKASSAGTLSLGPVPGKTTVTGIDRFTQLVVADARGRRQQLYLASSTQAQAGLDRFPMPPPPPEGAMNVRYATQRFVEQYDPAAENSTSWPLVVSGVSRPLRFSLATEAPAGIRLFVEEIVGSRVISTEELSPGRQVLVGEKAGSTMALRAVPGSAVPREFALLQNYPNPFNPSTRIDYALPVDSRVNITIYDITGREVVRLVDGVQPAGHGSVTWDGRNASAAAVGSGVYFCRCEATGTDGKATFTSAKKMLLIK